MKIMELEIDMPQLWPPLDDVRRALRGEAEQPPAAAAAPPAAGPDPLAQQPPVISTVPAVLLDLAQTRRELASWSAAEVWNSGDIVAVTSQQGVIHGVLLDHQLAQDDPTRPHLWRGWLAVAEADWAGPYDVLLEPDDEPFDPISGVIQAWNPVHVREQVAPRLGRLTAARLAAVRAVQDESAGRVDSDLGQVLPQPGFIGLRSAGGFSVLTGTPLARLDPRRDYQALYRDAAQELGRQSAAVAAPASVPATSAWSRLRGWLLPQSSWRPLLAGVSALLFAAVLIPVLLPTGGQMQPSGDDVRLRSAADPSEESVLGVRWRDDADADAVAELMLQVHGEVADGPDAAGVWRIVVPDGAVAQRALLASPMVAEVIVP